MARRPHIAVLAEAWNGLHRAILRGVGRYVQQRGHWSVFMPDMAPGAIPDLSRWGLDGVILASGRARRFRGIPTVSLRPGDKGLPSVSIDWRGVGRLAAEHLAECGVRQMAFFGADAAYTRPRLASFQQAAAALGHDVDVLEISTDREPWRTRTRKLGRWLSSLPRPAGVFAANDEFARYLTESAAAAGVGVPVEVAVLGCHDIAEICAMSVPELSSIDTDGERLGRSAAALLDRWLAGDRPPAGETLIPPRRVVERGSTAIVATGDGAVQQAVRFIRERACDPITPADAARAVHLSRRALELRFGKHLSLSPGKLILRCQLRRARQLLTETDRPMTDIAEACGFADAVRFSKTFAREQGQPPTAYRRQWRY